MLFHYSNKRKWKMLWRKTFSWKDLFLWFIRKKIKSSIHIKFIVDSVYDGFIILNKYLLLISGFNELSIINVNNYKLVRVIVVSSFSNYIISVCIINNNIVLTGGKEGNIG